MSDFAVILAVATAAALASPAGGLIALWRAPTSLFMSLSLGFASGVLLATVSFEMLPKSLELAPLPAVLGAFAAGFALVYALDLFIHRGQIAGEKAEQRKAVERRRLRRKPRGDGVTVLASATSVEELIEGVSTGIGAAIQPGLGLMVALAILVDNVSEALSIGQLIRDQQGGSRREKARRVLQWTGLIGASLFVSALVGWFFLRGLPEPVLGGLFAAGAGGMFYLTVTDLLPEAEARHYLQSAALAASAGFLLIFGLGRLH